METDRGAVLTIRAAARGLLDFGRSNRYDANWWRKVSWVLDSVYDRDCLEIDRISHQFFSRLLLSDFIKPEARQGISEALNESYGAILRRLFPWESRGKDQVAQSKIDQLVSAYKQHVGDPDDPEFMQEIIESISADRQRRERNKVENDEERIDRLLKDRDQKRAGTDAAST